MKEKILFCSLFLGFLFSALCAQCQTSLAYTQKFYDQALQGQTFLFNGPEYKRFKGYSDDHPFFELNYFREGSVLYEEEQYDSIPLLYDVSIDELIISHINHSGRVVELQLNKNKVKQFLLDGRHFIHLSGDTLAGEHAGSGFYNLLYEGKDTKMLMKRRVLQTESYDSNLRNFKTSFSKKDRFFLYHKGVFHAVRSKRSVLKILSKQRKALAQYIRKSDLNFRKQREQAILEVLKHYEKLEEKHD